MRSSKPMRALSLPSLLALLATSILAAPPTALAVERPPLVMVEAPEDAVQHRFELLRERIESRAGAPGVAADLYELEALIREGGSLERAATLLYSVAGSWRTHKEVRPLARRILAEVERQRGRLPRMAAQLTAIGVVTDAAVIGPFPNENGVGFDEVYGPEETGDLDAVHQGLRGEVTWRAIEGLGATGTLALDQAIRPGGEGVAYLLVDLRARRATEGTLYLGTPGPAKAWLRGAPILADPDTHPARFDQRALPLSLRAGSNYLLLKIAAREGPLQVEMRIAGRDGGRIPGLAAVAPAAGAYPSPRQAPRGRVKRGGSPLVDELAGLARSGRARALEDWARVLGERHPFDKSERLHVQAAARAAKAAPHRVEAQLLAARYQEEDQDERRRLLEGALLAERPGEALAHAALARHWLHHGQEWKAVQGLTQRVKAAPGDWPAQLTLARAWDAVGQPQEARRLVEGLVERHGDEPRLHLELARYARRDGQLQEAIRRWRVALALRPANLGAARSLASALVDAGTPRQADDVLAAVSRLVGLDVSLWAWRGELLGANGNLRAGRRLFEDALEVAPLDAGLWERLGSMELREGQTQRAVEAYQVALELSPQNARLGELLEALGGERPSFATAHLRDLFEEVGKADLARGEDAIRLSDVNVVQVLPSGQASRTVQRIVHVRTQRGADRFRTFPVRYAPGRERLTIERARILREDGSVEESHVESERSMNDTWSGIYYDARTRLIGFPSLRPTDTVELVYRIDDTAQENLLSDYFGDVQIAQDTVPIASWTYVLHMPHGRDIHFSELEGATYEAQESERGTTHTWTLEDVPKLVTEPRMPGWAEVARTLHVSTYGDWDAVAAYWWGLVEDQVAPTQMIREEAARVVAKIPPTDVRRRVQAIHAYVLEKTRYVGLELGIHSYKPYEVEQVLRRGFGDCKDKASLTYSLLQAIGIDSRLVLLRMRHLGSIPEWPASLAVFNHAILYIPSLDLYLDGTAEWSGSEELPLADRGAEILIVHPDGTGTRGRTDEAPVGLSSTSSRWEVRLGEGGVAQIVGETEVAGLGAARRREAYGSTNRRLAAHERIWSRAFPGTRAHTLETSDPRALEAPLSASFEVEAPGFAKALRGGGLALYPFGRSSALLSTYAPLSRRSYDLLLSYPWRDTVVMEVEIPEGMVATEIPADEALQSPFGTLSLRFEVEGEVLRIERELAFSTSRVQTEAYEAFRSHLALVDALLERRVVLSPASPEGAEKVTLP